MELHPRQVDAIDACLNSPDRIVAITGQAGTGKTTIIRQVAEAFSARGIAHSICAPTGKAARRVTQATGRSAATVHRLLEYPRPGERDKETGKVLTDGLPKRGHDNPLVQRVIIADEYAMVGNELDRNLIDALARGARLLVFGDVSQLSPIEKSEVKALEGSPFERHLKKKSIALEHVYRQEEGGGILESANLIRQGRTPRQFKDFHMIFTDRPVQKLQQLVQEKLDQGIDFRSFSNQIITPSRRTWVGTTALNVMLNRVLNPTPSNFNTLARHVWDKQSLTVAMGDKVVCTENMYDMRDYTDRFAVWKSDGEPEPASYIETPPSKLMLNGETGIIIGMFEDGTLHIETDDRIVEVPGVVAEWSWKSNRVFDVFPGKNIDLAYALTTHKVQGSEYEEVIYVLNRSLWFMLNRRNFYTAVTRAKKKVTIITDQKSLQTSLMPERSRK